MDFLFFKFNNFDLIEKIKPTDQLVKEAMKWKEFRLLLEGKMLSGELILVYHPQIIQVYNLLEEKINLEFTGRYDYINGLILVLDLRKKELIFEVNCQNFKKSFNELEFKIIKRR